MANKRVIFSLYRTKLRLCIREHYVPGQWIDPNKLYGWTKNEYYLASRDAIDLKNLERMKRYHALGNFIWSTVRWKYKVNKKISNTNEINTKIDEAFSALRNINSLLYSLRPKLPGKS